MIQRYDIDCHAVDMYKYDEGKYYKVSDIAPLIEWRPFETDSPRFSSWVTLCKEDDKAYVTMEIDAQGQVSDINGHVAYHSEIVKGVMGRVKWKYIESEHWWEKQ